jgi:hypothetical protein
MAIENKQFYYMQFLNQVEKTGNQQSINAFMAAKGLPFDEFMKWCNNNLNLNIDCGRNEKPCCGGCIPNDVECPAC